MPDFRPRGKRPPVGRCAKQAPRTAMRSPRPERFGANRLRIAFDGNAQKKARREYCRSGWRQRSRRTCIFGSATRISGAPACRFPASASSWSDLGSESSAPRSRPSSGCHSHPSPASTPRSPPERTRNTSSSSATRGRDSSNRSIPRTKPRRSPRSSSVSFHDLHCMRGRERDRTPSRLCLLGKQLYIAVANMQLAASIFLFTVLFRHPRGEMVHWPIRRNRSIRARLKRTCSTRRRNRGGKNATLPPTHRCLPKQKSFARGRR